MTSLFVSRSRKVKFEVSCTLHDLTNLPYVSGLYFAKWKLKGGGSAGGVSQRATVRDHVVSWEEGFSMEVNMVIGKDGVLLPCELLIVIKQEINAGKSSEDLGVVCINLAEYAGEQISSRRYLLQEARVNSIAKVSIGMKLIKGDATFKVPSASKTDISLEGIRGIFADDAHDDRQMHSLSRLEGAHHDAISRTHSMLGADDPNVDFVNQIFASAHAQSS